MPQRPVVSVTVPVSHVPHVIGLDARRLWRFQLALDYDIG